jgi:YidC/Oxa1 family membrane protein insertase
MSTASMDKNQRYLMLGLPFFFVPFIWSFPAGSRLLDHTNTWTIAQQAIVKKRLGPLRPPSDDPPESPFAALGQLFKGDDADGKAPAKKPAAVAAGVGSEGRGAARAPKSRPAGPPAAFAAQEEEAIREAPMTDDEDMEPIDRVQDLLRRSPMRWISTPRSRSRSATA